MTKNNNHNWLMICLLLLTGCQPDPDQSADVITIPFERTETIDIEQFVEGVRYVQLQNHPESAFIDIDKLLVSGSDIFMLDKRLEAVFCFDTTGRFRFRIQQVGRGPGEYQELDAIWVNPERSELWLQSFWPSKIMVYNFDGQKLREFAIRWSARDMVGLGEHLFAGYNTDRSNDGVDSLAPGIFLLNEAGEFIRQPLILGDSTIYWRLACQRSLEEYGDGALILSQSDTIYAIDRQGQISPDVCLDWGKYRYPDDLRKVHYNTARSDEALTGNYIIGKDQLIAFGPVRLFRIFLDTHMELALADLKTKKGIFSTRMSCSMAKVPLLYPLEKSDQGELVGMYDMPFLLAVKESQSDRKKDPRFEGTYRVMDSLVESALRQDRPIVWFAKIKKEWL